MWLKIGEDSRKLELQMIHLKVLKIRQAWVPRADVCNSVPL